MFHQFFVFELRKLATGATTVEELRRHLGFLFSLIFGLSQVKLC